MISWTGICGNAETAHNAEIDDRRVAEHLPLVATARCGYVRLFVIVIPLNYRGFVSHSSIRTHDKEPGRKQPTNRSAIFLHMMLQPYVFKSAWFLDNSGILCNQWPC